MNATARSGDANNGERYHPPARAVEGAAWGGVRVTGLLACLGLLGAPLANGLSGTGPCTLLAQAPEKSGRLTVRRSMATGTQTAQAGIHLVDSIRGAFVYVPKQAVGTQRVPLVVVLHGGGVSPRELLNTQYPLADQYGMILLAPEISGPVLGAAVVQAFDATLTHVLQTFAIEAEHVAITGMSNGGYAALILGCANPEVFSRVAPLSPVPARYPGRSAISWDVL